MTNRRRETKIVDTLGKLRPTRTTGEEDRSRKDVPEVRIPGKKGRKIFGPCKEERKYVVPWAIVE